VETNANGNSEQQTRIQHETSYAQTALKERGGEEKNANKKTGAKKKK
jgi:hypothetical protein